MITPKVNPSFKISFRAIAGCSIALMTAFAALAPSGTGMPGGTAHAQAPATSNAPSPGSAPAPAGNTSPVGGPVAPSPGTDKMVVRTVNPSTEGLTNRPYETPGRTEPIESATVFTRATGIIKSRNFDIGDVVKAGDIIAVVDAPDIDRSVDAARAAVDVTIARAKNARDLSDRSNKLLQSKTVSVEEAEQRLGNALEADASVRQAKSALERLEEQQRFSVVHAPFDGVIAARNFDRGDRVRGDSATQEGWLYRIVRLDTLRFAINAAPDLALRLAQQKTVKVRFNEFPGQTFVAKVARSSRNFDTASGTMRVELQLENKDLSIPAGLTGTAAFDLPPMAGTFLVPTNTLIVREGKTTVATVDGGKVKYVDVSTGRNFGQSVEVTSTALAKDSSVIINPNALLRAGDAVEASPLIKMAGGK
ncbi:MAG: efflux RND transporter periplasmic adaptor subunit [Candidatus Methylacidiphilales bacterium]|nr:efflux RND transporter periplasmic adaptor subunit [Candidatus Methylacidiphilales bacterium]